MNDPTPDFAMRADGKTRERQVAAPLPGAVVLPPGLRPLTLTSEEAATLDALVNDPAAVRHRGKPMPKGPTAEEWAAIRKNHAPPPEWFNDRDPNDPPEARP